MKKRFIAFLLISALISAIFPGTVLAVVEENTDIFDFLNKMKIVSESELTEENSTEPISRMNFAVFMARALGIDEMGITDTNYYYDVPEDHWGKFCINKLTEMGILSADTGIFRPDDALKKEEAARIAVDAIGLGIEAERRGGYPSGYLEVATKEGLFSGSGASEKISYSAAASIVYNVLMSEAVQMDLTLGAAQYSRQGDTVLSMYHKVYEHKGQLQAVHGASVSEKTAKKGEIIIDNNAYLTDGWYYDYLGMQVSYFYRDMGDELELIYINKDSKQKNDVTYLTSDMYEGYNNGTLTYDAKPDEDRRLKTLNIYSGAVIIRNGVNLSDNMTAALAPFYGNMRIIDTGRFNGADIIIIEDYVNIAVGMINTTKCIINDKYNPSLSVDLSEENNEAVKYYSLDNEEKSFGDISKDDVVSVAQNSTREFTLVVLSGMEIRGTISSKRVDGNKAFLTIDDVEYPAEIAFYNSNGNVMSLQVSGVFKTDVLGKIAYYSLEKSAEYKYAFLINAFADCEIDGRIFDEERVVMRLFTEDGEMLKKPCAVKVKVDITTYTNNIELLERFKLNGEISPQLIRFKYDSNGDIRVIDTGTYYDKEGKYSLRRQDLEKNLYASWFGMIGQNSYLTTDTKVMVVPPEGEEKTADYSAYMMKNSAYLQKSENIRVDLFQLDPESLKIDFAVYYQSSPTTISNLSHTALHVVEKIKHTITEDCEPVYGLTLDSTGANTDYIVAPTYISSGENIDPSTLNRGDIIRIGVNYKNEITTMQRVFDYEQACIDGDFRFFDNSIKSDYIARSGNVHNSGNFFTGAKISYGYVSLVDGNVLQWGYEKPGDRNEVYNVTASSNKAQILVYDDENSDDFVKLGKISDIVGYYQSSTDFSKIVSRARAGIIEQLIVYK